MVVRSRGSGANICLPPGKLKAHREERIETGGEWISEWTNERGIVGGHRFLHRVSSIPLPPPFASLSSNRISAAIRFASVYPRSATNSKFAGKIVRLGSVRLTAGWKRPLSKHRTVTGWFHERRCAGRDIRSIISIRGMFSYFYNGYEACWGL